MSKIINSCLLNYLNVGKRPTRGGMCSSIFHYFFMNSTVEPFLPLSSLAPCIDKVHMSALPPPVLLAPWFLPQSPKHYRSHLKGLGMLLLQDWGTWVRSHGKQQSGPPHTAFQLASCSPLWAACDSRLPEQAQEAIVSPNQRLPMPCSCLQEQVSWSMLQLVQLALHKFDLKN